jgi:hypothetical protein
MKRCATLIRWFCSSITLRRKERKRRVSKFPFTGNHSADKQNKEDENKTATQALK